MTMIPVWTDAAARAGPARAGTERNVKADPTSRGCPGRRGREPRSQTFRRPFLSRTVVMVAVDTRERVAIASGVRGIERAAPLGIDRACASCWGSASRQGRLGDGGVTSTIY